MTTRSPIAIGFYPGTAGVCGSAPERYLRKASTILAQGDKIAAGIVPHAGWIYSGYTAATVYYNVSRLSQPKIFVLLGSVHVVGGNKPAIMSEGSWETPLGEIGINSELAQHLDRYSLRISLDYITVTSFPKEVPTLTPLGTLVMTLHISLFGIRGLRRMSA